MSYAIKEIQNTNGKYLVDTFGNVINEKTKKKRNGSINKDGYLRHNILKKPIFAHRLVAMAFIPNPDNKRTVNHIDGNKLNNCLENLEWATDKENLNHAFKFLQRKGSNKGKFGANHNISKQTIQLSSDGFLIGVFDSQRDASKKTGVHASGIGMCVRNKRSTAGGFIWR